MRLTITPGLVQRFAGYLLREPAWGVLHVQFADANWKLVPGSRRNPRPPPGTKGHHLQIWNLASRLSPSQAKRLCARAEELVRREQQR